MTETTAAGATAEQPLYFKWVRDADGGINWGRVILSLSLTVLAAYISVQTQRTTASPDFHRTVKMGAAQRQISAGVRIQRLGRRLEAAGWTAYENARSS
jgi:hypothetical protein